MKEFLNEAVYGLQRSAIREFSKLAKNTPGCIALTLGEPDADTPAPVVSAACNSLNSGETHYIENNGSAALRSKIAAYEKQKHNLEYSPDEIIVTAGATEALFIALMGIINPGDEVIIPTPAFVLYQEIVKLCRGVPVCLDTCADGFQINGAKLNALMNDRTKAIVLNTPNNPTGCVYGMQSLENVHAAVSGKPVFVLCDDVYRELSYCEDLHSFAEFTDVREQIIVIQSYSKPWAMTGWRMGYLMAVADVKERLELIHQFSVVSTPAPFQKAAIEALDFDCAPLRETYRKRRDYVLERLNAMGLETVVPQGAFYVFPSIEKFSLSSADFCRRMISEAGLAGTPGYCFGAEGYIRFSYAASDEKLIEGMNRLESFIKKLERERA